MLINCLVTTQLICASVFAYAECRFSHDADHLLQEDVFQYSGQKLSSVEPHIFAIAEAAYQRLNDKNKKPQGNVAHTLNICFIIPFLLPLL